MRLANYFLVEEYLKKYVKIQIFEIMTTEYKKH